MTVSLPNVVMLGAGSMGGAILAGLAAEASGASGLAATNRTREKAQLIASDRIESVALVDEPNANLRLVANAGVVVLGVKPAMIVGLAEEIATSLRAGTVVISVAAGITTATLEGVLPDSVSVVRAMPNTPSLVGLGVTGIAAGVNADDRALELAKAVFEAVGEVLVVDEAQINALSAISGSGPAYVFYFIEQLVASAERLGFSTAQATTMVENTFRGASELLAAADVGPAELRRRVTSPNGTTERAIGVLEQANFGGVFDSATAAAIARADELGG